MRRCFLVLLFTGSLFLLHAQSDSAILRKIYDYHLTQSKTYKNLEQLCKKIGARLSGSINAEKSVEWTKKAMYAAGADTVYLVPCMVPKWIRGVKESCIVQTPKAEKKSLAVCALGGSVGTPAQGVTAQVVEITSYEQLKSIGERGIKGKIVFYNVPFDNTVIRCGSAYGKAVKFRYSGASEAAKYGAVATILRSMTHALNNDPHTGMMVYDSTVSSKIPCFAVSTLGAEWLHEKLVKESGLKMTLRSSCRTEADVPSFSVVGEIRGSDKPNEFIAVGGHLDSWDLGEGAHDDGAGVVQSIEVLAAIKSTGIKPRRSIRAVAFMNEENGLRGAKSYAKWVKDRQERHIAAIESDAGGFSPRGIGVEANGDTLAYYKKWQNLFEPYLITIHGGGGGADIGPMEDAGTIMMSLEPDSQRYFDFHHTPSDTFENVHKRELELGSAAMTAWIYLIDKYGVYGLK